MKKNYQTTGSHQANTVKERIKTFENLIVKKEKSAVDLSLSCNGNQPEEQDLNRGSQIEHPLRQIDFINRHKDEIENVWEANKDKMGYIEVYITPDYKTYRAGFRFIEKRIRIDAFKILSVSATDSYAFVHFLWEATYTYNRIAVAL